MMVQMVDSPSGFGWGRSERTRKAACSHLNPGRCSLVVAEGLNLPHWLVTETINTLEDCQLDSHRSLGVGQPTTAITQTILHSEPNPRLSLSATLSAGNPRPQTHTSPAPLSCCSVISPWFLLWLWYWLQRVELMPVVGRWPLSLMTTGSCGWHW